MWEGGGLAAIHLQEYLARFIPTAYLARFDQFIAAVFQALEDQILLARDNAGRRIAAWFGFGRSQILALAELFNEQRELLRLQRQLALRRVGRDIVAVTTAQVERIITLQQEVARALARRNDEVQAELERQLPTLTAQEQERLRLAIGSLGNMSREQSQRLAAVVAALAANSRNEERQAQLREAIPELTPEQVAAALTMVASAGELGREQWEGLLATVSESQQRLAHTQEQLAQATRGLTTTQLAYLRDVAQSGEEFIGTARATTLARLQGIPRLLGQGIVVATNLQGQISDSIIAGRNNRLQLAQGTETTLGRALESTLLARRRLIRVAQFATEALRGVSDEPLNISEVAIVPVSPTHTIISWQTNKAAMGKVNWGETTTYGAHPTAQGGEVGETFYTQRHSVHVTDLRPGTTYYFEVLATDLSGQQTYDAFYSFTTGE